MKKGFTLVEMIGVVTILAVIMLIAAIPVTKVLQEFNENAYQKQLDSAIAAARLWADDNSDKLPEDIGGFSYVTLVDLQSAGYLETDFKNPKTKQNFSSITITVTKTGKKRYSYVISEVDGTEIQA